MHTLCLKETFCRDVYPTATLDKNSPSLSGEKIFKIKKFALRRGIWFKALSRIERGILDLTMKYVNNIKSTRLAKVLTAIIEKLHQAMESKVDKLMKSIGLPLAEKISRIAVKLGNISAKNWASDLSFATYLAVMHTNR